MHFFDFFIFYLTDLNVSAHQNTLYIVRQFYFPFTAMKNCGMLGHLFNLIGFIFHKSMMIIINYI